MAEDFTLISQARLQKAAIESTGKKVRVKKPPVPSQPIAQEIAYRTKIRAFIDIARKLVNALVISSLTQWTEEAQGIQPSAARTDDYVDDITETMRLMRAQYSEDVPDSVIADTAAAQAASVNQVSRKQMTATFTRVLGVQPFQAEPWLLPAEKAFVADNVSLITSISDDYFSQVEGIVSRGVRAGQRTSVTAGQLRERFKVADSRAQLIARDQTSKFHGELNKLRQTEAGVDSYIWRTANDERVRDTHVDKEGRKFKWSEPPADTGHPGEDINCRCVAEPVIEV